MFPNPRMLVAAVFASIIAMIAGVDVMASFGAGHQPLVRMPRNTFQLNLAGNKGSRVAAEIWWAAPPGPDATHQSRPVSLAVTDVVETVRSTSSASPAPRPAEPILTEATWPVAATLPAALAAGSPSLSAPDQAVIRHKTTIVAAWPETAPQPAASQPAQRTKKQVDSAVPANAPAPTQNTTAAAPRQVDVAVVEQRAADQPPSAGRAQESTPGAAGRAAAAPDNRAAARTHKVVHRTARRRRVAARPRMARAPHALARAGSWRKEFDPPVFQTAPGYFQRHRTENSRAGGRIARNDPFRGPF
jgi:cytoskeletal protein RodZ